MGESGFAQTLSLHIVTAGVERIDQGQAVWQWMHGIVGKSGETGFQSTSPQHRLMRHGTQCQDDGVWRQASQFGA